MISVAREPRVASLRITATLYISVSSHSYILTEHGLTIARQSQLRAPKGSLSETRFDPIHAGLYGLHATLDIQQTNRK